MGGEALDKQFDSGVGIEPRHLLATKYVQSILREWETSYTEYDLLSSIEIKRTWYTAIYETFRQSGEVHHIMGLNEMTRKARLERIISFIHPADSNESKINFFLGSETNGNPPSHDHAAHSCRGFDKRLHESSKVSAPPHQAYPQAEALVSYLFGAPSGTCACRYGVDQQHLR